MADSSDPIINLMQEKTEKWKKISQRKKIGGQLNLEGITKKTDVKISPLNIDFFPIFISMSHKSVESVNISSCDTGFKKDPKYVTDKYNDIRIELRAGDTKAHAIEYESSEAPREKDIGALANIIDDSGDSCFKDALATYFIKLGDLCKTRDSFLLKNISKEKKIDYIEKNQKTIKKKDIDFIYDLMSKISKRLDKCDSIEDFNVSANMINETRRFVNSEGTKIITHLYRGSLGVSSKVKHKNGGSSWFGNNYYWKDISELRKNKKILGNLENIFKDAMRLKKAPAQESGFFPAIFTPITMGVLFHEAIAAHLLSAKNVLEQGSTVFGIDKIGKLIVPNFVTLIDNPSIKGGWGSYLYDEEGVPGKRTVLVEDGILRNYLTDRTTAAFLKQKSNGHSRAEESADPEPRISNLYMTSSQKNGLNDLEKAMMNYCKRKNLKYGLIVEAGAGDVTVNDDEKSSGTFRIYPNRVWRLYTNGKKEMVSRTWIIGQAYQTMKNLLMLGGKYKTSYGSCGSDSGWVFTQETMPYAFLEGVEFRRESEKDIDEDRLDEENEDKMEDTSEDNN